MNSFDLLITIMGFVLLSGLLFMPQYIASGFNSGLNELLRSREKKSWKLIFRRHTNDPFRFSVDFLAISVISFLFKENQLAPILLYFIVFSFVCYSEIFYKLYGSAVLYNDFKAIILGVKIYLLDYSWKKIWHLIVVILFFSLLAHSLNAYFLSINKLLGDSVKLHITLASAMFLGAYIYKFKLKFVRQLTIHVQAFNLLQNILNSWKARKLVGVFERLDFNKFRKEARLEISDKPNIIMVFLESYGEVAYSSASFLQALKELEADLAQSPWHCVSSLSEAPVTGGQSWLSYGSFLHGFRIDSGSVYNALLNNSREQYEYSFTEQLRTQGYTNYRLSSIKSRENLGLSHLSNFYGVDKWITFDDYQYAGQLYGFGPSIPDQYSLNRGLELARTQQCGKPFSLFFITQDTHYPFVAPPILSDWKEHNLPTEELFESQFFKKPEPGKYFLAIENQIRVMIKSVIKNGAENDIFIFMGDHQPPLIKSNNTYTPVHILSRNENFVTSLENYHFEKGLSRVNAGNLKHEGLQSILSRELSVHYGSAKETELPEYYPEGLCIIQ